MIVATVAATAQVGPAGDRDSRLPGGLAHAAQDAAGALLAASRAQPSSLLACVLQHSTILLISDCDCSIWLCMHRGQMLHVEAVMCMHDIPIG